MEKSQTVQIVVMTCDEEHDRLRTCLDSIVAQTHKPDEVIVVDHGTSPAARRLCYLYQGHHVSYRRSNKEDKADRCAEAVAHGASDAVVILQSTTKLQKDAVETVVKRLAKPHAVGDIRTQPDGSMYVAVNRSELIGGDSPQWFKHLLGHTTTVKAVIEQPPPPTPARDEPQVTAILLCHPPFLKYLPQCLRSVVPQVSRTILAYDGEIGTELHEITDAVGLPRMDIMRPPDRTHNLCLMRNWAAKQATTPFLLFVDADNWLQDGYVESMLLAMRNNPNAAIAYPQIEIFNDQGDIIREPVLRKYDYNQLCVQNYIENCSLVRAEAFWSVGGFDPFVMGYMDWDTWVRILRPETGWIATPCDALLHYRQHPDCHSDISRREQWPQRIRVNRSRRAVFIPFSGRTYCVEPMLRFLCNMKRSVHDEYALYFYDNSPPNSPVSHSLRMFLAAGGCSWGTTCYHRDEVQVADVLPQEQKFEKFRGMDNAHLLAHDVGPEIRATISHTMAQRTAAIYSWMLAHVQEELVLIVEDDTEPPPDVWDKLLLSLDHCIPAAVSGWYIDRMRNRPIVSRETGRHPLRHKPLDPPQPGDGRPEIEQVHAAGLGTTLLYLALLRLRKIRFRWWAEAPDQIIYGTDNALGYDLRKANLKQFVNWGCRCKHWKSETEYV